MGNEVDLLPADKHKIFYKLIVSFWMCIAGHAQSTQSNKFATSLQHLEENMKDKIDFLK